MKWQQRVRVATGLSCWQIMLHLLVVALLVVADVLEELTTTWYFGAALIVLWLLSRVLENNFLLAIAGLAILAGPAVVSLLAKDKKLHHLTSKHRVRR